VRPAVGTGCRWQSKKKEGEENLQERERGIDGVCFATGEELR
jgi:hypothetical protein